MTLHKRSALMLCALAVSGCASTPEATKVKHPEASPTISNLSEKAQQEQQEAILKMSKQTLRQLHALKPATRAEVEQAAGYGVFEVNGLNAVLEKTHGRGVIFEKGGQPTFMQLVRTDVGPNARLKPYRQVLVFRNSQKLQQFVASGSPNDTVRDPDIKVYRVDRKGVAVQTGWGARYTRNPDLNAATAQ